MNRPRALLAALAASLLILASPCALAQPGQEKVLRYAFEIAETNFDPQHISDVYSDIVISGIYEPPLTYDYLARPLRLEPLTAASLPEVSDGGRTYTVHIKPGIYFADDPAFGGKRRELTAADFIYGLKRVLDPKVSASQIAEIEPYVVGAAEAAEAARKANHFDYDKPIAGLKVLDRYTFQVKLDKPNYTFIYNFADCRITCPVAREVVERYGDDFGSHPVGTGPWRLTYWKRSSKMIFERNPGFREEYFDAHPNADDERGQRILARLKGRRLPMIDRVEISIIEETQPMWLSFLNGEMDLLYLFPTEFAYQAIPDNKLAPGLAKRGIRMEQAPALDLTYAYFNMDDPVFGGYTPDKVALRRAIALSYKVQDEISIIRKGQAIPAETPYSPGVAGYDADFRTGANDYDPVRAKALLDMFGYVDRDGDGWRDQPDGSPLVLHRYSTPIEADQQFDELWKRSLDDIGIRMEVIKGKWPDLLASARLGKLQFWQLGGSASSPDADTWLSSLYGKNLENNLARFRLPEYDRLYEAARAMPDSPERTKLYEQMAKIVVAYVPWRINVHRIRTSMWYPWLIGFRRSPMLTYNFWKYVDIDPQLERTASR
ncbi:MAG TPA: ABC transporter substrate-binding protein [Usitatibacter sp.]|nr:ABC transporter substrate-binding protein [Usitatibacter sp.]